MSEVWLEFPMGEDAPRADEVPVFRLARPRHYVPERAWGKENELFPKTATHLRRKTS
jgi:hypothetical protein